MKTTEIDGKKFKDNIKHFIYPCLIIAHGKHCDDYYLATNEDSLLSSFLNIFEINSINGYYDDTELDSEMTELDIAAFVYKRSCSEYEYERITIHQFVN